MMDIFEVGTGGGWIARVEEGGLRVGPQAPARAGPGLLWPRRPQPTVTDANPVLGRLGADRSLAAKCGSTSRPQARAARTRGETARHRPTAAADGILRIAATAMSYAVKGVTTERGLDAGTLRWSPMAAPDRCTRWRSRARWDHDRDHPDRAGSISAFGMLFSDLRYDFVRTWSTSLEDAPFDRIERIYRDLENRAVPRSPAARSSRRRSP